MGFKLSIYWRKSKTMIGQMRAIEQSSDLIMFSFFPANKKFKKVADKGNDKALTFWGDSQIVVVNFINWFL